MTDVVGNPEEERKSDFFNQPWTQEAVHRYFYKQVCLFKSSKPLMQFWVESLAVLHDNKLCALQEMYAISFFSKDNGFLFKHLVRILLTTDIPSALYSLFTRIY